jgi:hypothetical protein
MNDLAVVDYNQGRYAQAEVLQSRIVEIRRRASGLEHPETLNSMHNLADAYTGQRKYAQAETPFTRTLEIQRRVLGPEHPNTLFTLSAIATMYQRKGKYALAETYPAQDLAGLRRGASQERYTAGASSDVALANLSQGKFVESEPLAHEALKFYRMKQPDNWQRFRAESLLGASLAGQKKYAEAELLLLEGYQGMLARKQLIAVPDWYHLDRAREWIVELYQAWGRPEKAFEWGKKRDGP